LPNLRKNGNNITSMFTRRLASHAELNYGFAHMKACFQTVAMAWRLFRRMLPTATALALFVATGSVRAADPTGDKTITYKNDRIEAEPWSIHIVKIARSDPTLEIRSTLARGTVLGLSTVSDQILALPTDAGTPLAGVNGDFYERDNGRYAGDPRGLQIVEGDLVSDPTGNPNYCAFWIDAEGNPHVGDVTSQFKVTFPNGQSFPFGLNEQRDDRRSGSMVLYTPTLGRSTRTTGGKELILEKTDKGAWTPFRVGETYTAKLRQISETGNTKLEKDTLVLSISPRLATNLPPLDAGAEFKISTATLPDLHGVRTAIGGGSIITRDGKKAKLGGGGGGSFSSFSVSSMFERHPRSAVGFSKTHVYLVEVDGRQRGLSVGMKLEELGEYMAKIGCEEAINLDGGGSATFWYRGRVVNSPCDGTERTVANGLVVMRKPKTAGH
jgi:exopolysaccharide biosynthesis protein